MVFKTSSVLKTVSNASSFVLAGFLKLDGIKVSCGFDFHDFHIFKEYMTFP